jgi:hypothetical protein
LHQTGVKPATKLEPKIPGFLNKSGLVFLIKKPNNIAQLQKWLFSAPYSSLPTTAFGNTLAKNLSY